MSDTDDDIRSAVAEQKHIRGECDESFCSFCEYEAEQQELHEMEMREEENWRSREREPEFASKSEQKRIETMRGDVKMLNTPFEVSVRTESLSCTGPEVTTITFNRNILHMFVLTPERVIIELAEEVQ